MEVGLKYSFGKEIQLIISQVHKGFTLQDK